MSMKRIFIYSEDLSYPFDEGIKNTAFALIHNLSGKARMKGACKRCDLPPDSGIVKLPTNRLLLSFRLARFIQKHKPDQLIYIPWTCGTFASFVRMKILSMYSPKAVSIMVLLQPKRIKKRFRFFMNWLKPDLILTPSPQVLDHSETFGIRAEFLPLSVNSEVFKPVSGTCRKAELRLKYRVPLDKRILLHVGHINEGRNLRSLIPFQDENNQVLVVGSSSTRDVSFKDEKLLDFLIKSGIQVIDTYIEDIHEIYQLSDVYVFPVKSEGSCIGIPLSVLEASACGLPVITTDFGGLRRILQDQEDSVFFLDPADFPHRLSELLQANRDISESARKAVERINQQYDAALDRMIHI